jgi:hypothetical protein
LRVEYMAETILTIYPKRCGREVVVPTFELCLAICVYRTLHTIAGSRKTVSRRAEYTPSTWKTQQRSLFHHFWASYTTSRSLGEYQSAWSVTSPDQCRRPLLFDTSMATHTAHAV